MLFVQHVDFLSYDTLSIYMIYTCQNWKGGGFSYVKIVMYWHPTGSCNGKNLLEASWMDEIGYILYMSQMIGATIINIAIFEGVSWRGILLRFPLVFACEQKSELEPAPTWSSITIPHLCIYGCLSIWNLHEIWVMFQYMVMEPTFMAVVGHINQRKIVTRVFMIYGSYCTLFHSNLDHLHLFYFPIILTMLLLTQLLSSVKLLEPHLWILSTCLCNLPISFVAPQYLIAIGILDGLAVKKVILFPDD